MTPPVNQVPSLTLGRLIYWGLFNGPPFGRLTHSMTCRAQPILERSPCS